MYRSYKVIAYFKMKLLLSVQLISYIVTSNR